MHTLGKSSTRQSLHHPSLYLSVEDKKIRKEESWPSPCCTCSSCSLSPCWGTFWLSVEQRPTLRYKLLPAASRDPTTSCKTAVCSYKIHDHLSSEQCVPVCSPGKQVLTSLLAHLPPLRPLVPWPPCALCALEFKHNSECSIRRHLLSCFNVRGHALSVSEFGPY